MLKANAPGIHPSTVSLQRGFEEKKVRLGVLVGRTVIGRNDNAGGIFSGLLLNTVKRSAFFQHYSYDEKTALTVGAT
ncbi:MAG: hypothetical protein WBC78_21475 [Candidatus Sulfotelmatobacter sp.]